ncbi:MAG: thioredoxin-like domain-containing protein [Bacteroidota bacterium]
MRVTLAICATILFTISCKTPNDLKQVTVTGEVYPNDITEVRFVGVIDNSIGDFGAQYVAHVDSNSQFSVVIPIERMATGRMYAGNIYQHLVFIPGDSYHIEIYDDSLFFGGKGAEKNNFLFAANKAGTGERQFAAEYNKGKLSPSEFASEMNDFKKKRLAFLDTYSNINNLEPEFLDFYNIETQIIYENRIQGYPRKYAYVHKTPVDSLELSDEYLRLNCLENFMDDRKVISFNYIHNLRNFLFKKGREVIQMDPSFTYPEAMRAVLFDSLQGKTQEYVMAKWVISEFTQNRFDTLVYNTFLKLDRDKYSTRTVEKAYTKYNEKQSLIGQPLHSSFTETMIVDTSNVQLSFKEMMNKYEGEVVYLDLWSLRCAPCRSAMPHSRDLKNRLSDFPIEFVFLAQDPPSQNVWDEIFEVSLTDENHYRMVDHDWGTAKMLKFMEIDWVPCYMIFDKQGRLIDFSANRPYVQENIESELEKRLKQLARV